MIPNESYLFTISFNEPLWFTISDNEPHKAIRSTMSHNETQWAKINPNEQQRPNMSHTESRWVSIYLNNFIFLEWVTMRRNERQLVAMTHKSYNDQQWATLQYNESQWAPVKRNELHGVITNHNELKKSTLASHN